MKVCSETIISAGGRTAATSAARRSASPPVAMYIFLLLLAPVSECYGDPFLVAQRAVGRRSPHSPSFLAAAATTRSQAQHSTTTTSAATAFAAGSAMSRHGAPLLTAAAGDAGSPKSKLASAIVRYRSLLLLLCLVLHKCSTDGLTRWTRLQGAYSGKTVAVMSEVAAAIRPPR